MNKFAIIATALLMTGPAHAEDATADAMTPTGDAVAGEAQFNRQCVACHVVRDADGDVLAGRNARTGPNLYGIAGRQLGVIEEFRYGDALVQLGVDGTVWTEEAFVGYVQNPTAWLREVTGDARARSKMAYRVRSEEDALNLYAYLAGFAAE